jgi:hypothetical protein
LCIKVSTCMSKQERKKPERKRARKKRWEKDKLTVIANFSPNLGVTKPNTILPTVIPIQNPVATIPLANSSPSRTSSINLTIQPPSATSMPTYPRRKRAQSHVTRACGRRISASFMRLSFVPLVRGLAARNAAPVSRQKAVTEVASSMAAIAIWDC